MVARQSHGFEFESILENAFSAMQKSSSYTARYDGVFFDGFGKPYNVSIKTRNIRNELCLSDAKRISTDTDPLFLIEGIYKTRGNVDIIRGYNLKNGFVEFFGDDADNACREIHCFSDYMNHTSNINSRAYDKTWQKERADFQIRYRNIMTGKNACIVPRPKRDHKKQHRLQCAISRKNLEEVLSRKKIFEINLRTLTVFDIKQGESTQCDTVQECFLVAERILMFTR